MILNNSTQCKLIYFTFNYKKYKSTTITSMILLPAVYLEKNKTLAALRTLHFGVVTRYGSWDTGHIEDHYNDTSHKSKSILYSVLFTKLELKIAIIFHSLITKWKISEQYVFSWNMIGVERFLNLFHSLIWDD